MKTVNLDLRDNYKIVVISDVHGHKDHLDMLLRKLQLDEDDILIILGDFINRGRDSLKTYEYIKNLSKRKNTYVLKGNHEYFIHTCIKDKDKIERLHDFLKEEYYETIVGSVLDESDHNIHTITSDELLDYFDSHEVVAYLESLPIYLRADGHVFVHGGYDESFKEEGKFLKYDFYNDLSGINKDKIVVGHWPASNLRFHDLSNVPYFNDEKNIIFVDGGLGVKKTGELNALIISKENGKIEYTYDQYHDFIEGTIIMEHAFKHEPLVYVNFPHYQFEFIEKGKEMSLCKHSHSGMVFHVFNGLLYEEDGKYRLKTNYINRFLDLKVGDQVYVCECFEDCVLVKYKDVFGWVKRNQIQIKGDNCG
ncbi:hypothetical protein EZV73_07140 [Acidaminobacter sp. JC074]|uniref:metallophosphoesterase n=1 Tax=Acidaminobacter sp. JC074 TaxID=2530199 RepID=UPI001F117010|nr:metallophosphoesterase [Acidaminobacter sp. JC074]MCH4887339.1 hypothetical protein [Acidaminobacter sp. JC074]